MSAVPANFSFHVGNLPPETFLADVLAGLYREPKALPPKYFYDARGCELFEAICQLPEYYLTRTEIALMHTRAGEMARMLGKRGVLIEFGSGSSRKTRILLDALAPRVYVPVDIARDELKAVAGRLSVERPGLRVAAVCADFTQPVPLPPIRAFENLRRVLYFPGSTIGNLTPAEARAFLSRSSDLAGPGGAMLVGVDLKKDKARLEAAYDDAAGVTAAFNLNLLRRINHELGGDFDLARFRHLAFYNERGGRIEMHIASTVSQSVNVAGRTYAFRASETIHTENSHKYGIEEFQRLARDAGWEPAHCWTDPERLFAVHGLAVR
ncbi:MAG: L-histidine N(alpha)-methyltransferase [Burkholderiales bacterium]